ncbi:MAG: DUF29 domain-containing protein [Deltaproteobacteria bacterium]|nr:DUF29 domain-containing protein [Deltaproteobacteria bacterium]
MTTKPAATQQLYESDFALWLEEQALALKERRAAALDWDNLAEEIEGLVRSDRRALKSFLQNALMHMLELAYWEAERERNQRQCRIHLINARDEITNIIEDSPSLKNYLAEILDVTYERARREAETLIGRPLPEKCEWTLDQVRNDSFYPGPVIPPW